MPECAKTHLQQSRISKFSGGGPSSRGGEGGAGGEKERKEEGKDKEGTGEGRTGGMAEWGWSGVEGARHGLRPPRDKLWIRPTTRGQAPTLPNFGGSFLLCTHPFNCHITIKFYVATHGEGLFCPYPKGVGSPPSIIFGFLSIHAL